MPRLTIFHISRLVAVRTTTGYVPSGMISFDTTPLDKGDNFKDGAKFHAPIDGVYLFYFTGYNPNDDEYTQIDVMVNGDMLYNVDESWSRIVTFYFTIELKSNDELWLDNHVASSFYVGSDVGTLTFMGNLLN